MLQILTTMVWEIACAMLDFTSQLKDVCKELHALQIALVKPTVHANAMLDSPTITDSAPNAHQAPSGAHKPTHASSSADKMPSTVLQPTPAFATQATDSKTVYAKSAPTTTSSATDIASPVPSTPHSTPQPTTAIASLDTTLTRQASALRNAEPTKLTILSASNALA